MAGRPRRRWRDYRTAAGRRPVAEFVRALTDADAAAVAAAMKEVALEGLAAARHVRGEIYEVRADGDRVSYRILFATEGKRGQILFALEAFRKKAQKTPPGTIALAERRLRDWRTRGRLGHS
jgi:phage-related protein